MFAVAEFYVRIFSTPDGVVRFTAGMSPKASGLALTKTEPVVWFEFQELSHV
jgi:hypothetical protein